ncbi:hypothetical protein [Roseospira visakhapatnamensis]|uniref:Uncharacterized protein n=1 Tax=Roseospira visakhapatnamensis TaxID=390880 RepID=A0A7W6RCC0_9PROT|nr:hypothetical protein [Roseospira visakhapatnamensis]MBB4265379.1 hypothetical protein [Roseospira visakhapatnamensis]
MTGVMDDRAHMLAHRRFMEEVEMAVRAANQEIISHKIPHLDRKAFFRLAVSIARLRANYLDAVIAVDWDHADVDEMMRVQGLRTLYEEARAGFEALQQAFERGYITLESRQAGGAQR